MRRRDIVAPVPGGAAPDTSRPARAWGIGVASLAAAVLTWALQAIAGRMLGPESFAAFMVVWGFIFVEVGLLQGLQQEVTRAVASDPPASRGADAHPARTLQAGLLIGVGGAAVGMLSSPWWGPRLFGSGWPPTAAATAFAFVAYALYNVVNGGLAGRERWSDYSASLVTEGGLRFVLVVGVVVAGGGTSAQAWGLALVGLTWVLLLGRRGFRASALEPGDRHVAAIAAGAVHAMVATGCSAVLVAGFPVLLKLTASEPLPPEAGVVLAAVVATRAPLLLPLNAFQVVLLTRFVLARDRVRSVLGRVLVGVSVVTGLGAALAYAAGPWLLRLLYGPDFRIGAGLIAVLVLGAGLITMQTVSGSAVMALGRHRLFAAGWIIATVVAAALLTLELDVGARAALALTVGPVTGLVFNLAALTRRHTVAGPVH